MNRVLSALLVAVFLSSAAAQQGIENVDVPPSQFSLSTPGGAVDVKVQTSFSRQQSGQSVRITGLSIVDLSDLQQKLPTIVGALDVPKNNCQRFASDNVVASVGDGRLSFASNTPTLSISGLSSVWACLQNPTPETKVVWTIQQIAPGIKTKIPNVVTTQGAPLKTKLLDTGFEWSAPLVWSRPGKMQTGSATIGFRDASSNRDDRKPQWLDALSVNLVDQLNRTLTPFIDVNKIVPAEFAEKSPIIDAVNFVDQGGHLAAKVNWSANIPVAQDAQPNR
jgi:hypothetical protein